MSANLGFLKDFKKSVSKMSNVTMDFSPPKKWYSVGNLAVNKIFSGSFNKGIPEGRITCLAGPSGSGKSFISGNIARSAQQEGAFLLVIDSENAMDEVFLNNIGVDTTEEKMAYASVVTVHDVTEVTSSFIKGYEKDFGRDNDEAPHVVIIIDSLDMLLTEAEADNFEKGDQKGDQGQRAKQVKHLLRTLVNKIKRLNVSVVVTHQVYPADIMAGEGKWAVNNAIRYSASQIFLITKKKLKGNDGEVDGVHMTLEVFKSRFTKLGSKATIEVPYAKGMNPYSGFLEMMEKEGIVKKAGAWYSYTDPETGEEEKFQRTRLTKETVDKILSHPDIVKAEKEADAIIEGTGSVNTEIADLGGEIVDDSDDTENE